MRKALNILREECDYEDHHKGGTDNFVLRNKLAPGIGDGTISKLLEAGLIIEGTNKWFDKPGFRITNAGRSSLQ